MILNHSNWKFIFKINVVKSYNKQKITFNVDQLSNLMNNSFLKKIIVYEKTIIPNKINPIDAAVKK